MTPLEQSVDESAEKPSTKQKPSIGRIVHVQTGKPQHGCAAAIITKVDDERVDLVVFSDDCFVKWHDVPLNESTHSHGDETHTGLVDTWHWPERV